MKRRDEKRGPRSFHRVMVTGVLLASALISGGLLSQSSLTQGSRELATSSIALDSTSVVVPVGAADSSEPSGQAPPAANAMPGYHQTYVNDFGGSSLPSGWEVYTGQPGGDPGAQWGASHVVVSGGMLQLNTWKDPSYGGEWVAGGLCQCGVTANTYGAYFVRSRLTGPGPTQVELLWPTSGWPPEIDFDETFGGDTSSMATLHWSSANEQAHNSVAADMEQWHTWGVIWTPTSVTYTLDGHVWGQVDDPSEIPQQPMTLDLQQQTWCDNSANSSSPDTCPTAPESTQVDWVAEYRVSTTATSTTTTVPVVTTSPSLGKKPFTVGPFAKNSSKLTPRLRTQINALAANIAQTGYLNIVLTGYGDTSSTRARSLVISRDRALNVDRFLKRRLVDLKVSGVEIATSWKGSATGTSVSTSIPAFTPVVLARIG